jgi:prepilin-type N-terminal cleavage/methylation domain-containing protein
MAVTTTQRLRAGNQGYSMIEMMVVVALVGIVAGMIVPATQGMVTRAKADSSIQAVVTLLESTRNRAVAERRNFHLTFDESGKRIVVSRSEPDGSLVPTATLPLEAGMEFYRFTANGDTEEQFAPSGNASFSGTAPHMFTSDGTLIDDNGDVANGAIFLAYRRQRETAKAITFFGATGLVRTWQWGGTKWVE